MQTTLRVCTITLIFWVPIRSCNNRIYFQRWWCHILAKEKSTKVAIMTEIGKQNELNDGLD